MTASAAWHLVDRTLPALIPPVLIDDGGKAAHFSSMRSGDNCPESILKGCSESLKYLCQQGLIPFVIDAVYSATVSYRGQVRHVMF
jgi:hypothetical protein